MTTDRGQPTCDLYLPGHQWHWIQARKSADARGSYGKLVEVGEDAIVVEYLDRVGHYRNHHAGKILNSSDLGAKVRVVERFHMLGVDLPNGRHGGFCIALETDKWTPCSYEPLTDVTPEALAERLGTRGGFSVPGESVGGRTK